jgi:hypothetical protein
VCDSSDQAANYHHLGPKLGALFLTRPFGWKQNKKLKQESDMSVSITPTKQLLSNGNKLLRISFFVRFEVLTSSGMMETVRTSETSVENHFTRQYIPKDSSEHNFFRLKHNNEPHTMQKRAICCKHHVQ